jgi:hypothetical protein
MSVSQNSVLTDLSHGHSGPPIPQSTLAYFQQRSRNRLFNFIIERFEAAREGGLTKAQLARRIGRTPDQINRWLSSPSNLTVDTASDLLIGIAAEEISFSATSPLSATQHNYSRFSEISEEQRAKASSKLFSDLPPNAAPQANSACMHVTGAAAAAFSLPRLGKHKEINQSKAQPLAGRCR